MGSCHIRTPFPELASNTDTSQLSNSSIVDTIPKWFENFSSHIFYLDLSHQIGGKLPGFHGYDNLTHAFRQVINVTNNTITGCVPSSLGSLELLRSLHLQSNIFEGNLPATLQHLTRLVTMDLSNNLLTGSVPSWIGERLAKVCGPPLSWSCKRTYHISYNHVGADGDGDDVERLWFYDGMGLGFVIGFMGLLGGERWSLYNDEQKEEITIEFTVTIRSSNLEVQLPNLASKFAKITQREEEEDS
ncbi:hypothetical protein L6452_13551 [Arctium lappa]|uniref:Uncharacterized protein n=1 Tax=Arctium lappa TaxID=4217 RepID=A0ACB9CIU6_ARCLA|nr:hypothetical protein L6452_13551 [Arctium lappa]